jgi:hypothetical protein
VKSYNGVSYLVDCLVAPEDIGAVCDVRREDGAIRCRRYMVTGGHFAVSKVCTTHHLTQKCWMQSGLK